MTYANQTRNLREAIIAQRQGRDSLCQVARGTLRSWRHATAMDTAGMTLFIAPLNTHHQRCRLDARAGREEYLGLQVRDSSTVLTAVRRGDVDILHLDAGSMCAREVFDALDQAPLRAIIIDDAHCVSERGHEFRPEYLGVAIALRGMRNREIAVHAYTPIATEKVREDIIGSFGMRNPVFVVQDFDRPNLHLSAESARAIDVATGYENRVVAWVVASAPGMDLQILHPGIIYCNTYEECDHIDARLAFEGFRSRAYHDRLDDATLRDVDHLFARREIDILVTTETSPAIHREDVRWVLHAGLPSCMERYYAQISVAGHDGDRAVCHMLYRIIDHESSRGENAAAIADMDAYARLGTDDGSDVCRHVFLSPYFGHMVKPCRTACDVCVAGKTENE